MTTLHGGVRRAAWRLGFLVGRRRNYTLLERHYYSPVPDLERLSPDVFDRVTGLAGVELDTGAQMSWAERELREFVEEFEPPPGFRWDNYFYETGDAEIAYSMIRRLRPRRIVELGCGFSTLVLAAACARNRADGAPAIFKNFDPYRAQSVGDDLPGLDERHDLPAQEVPMAEFLALGEGDVLFVDTSHTVKLGGDVNFIVLDVLPRLAPGVWVHFHDIWLPHEYHRVLVEEMGFYWAEQYLLQAYLSGNSATQVMFATHAVARAEPERLQALIPRYTGENYPTGFWLRHKP